MSHAPLPHMAVLAPGAIGLEGPSARPCVFGALAIDSTPVPIGVIVIRFFGTPIEQGGHEGERS